jgi:hypothetical protein
MIPAMSRMVPIPSHIHGILDGLIRLLLSVSRFRFASPVGSLLLRLVVRMGLFVVNGATVAEKEQDLLSVARAHTASLVAKGHYA